MTPKTHFSGVHYLSRTWMPVVFFTSDAFCSRIIVIFFTIKSFSCFCTTGQGKYLEYVLIQFYPCRYARTFAFFYTIGLHVLVFTCLYRMSALSYLGYLSSYLHGVATIITGLVILPSILTIFCFSAAMVPRMSERNTRTSHMPSRIDAKDINFLYGVYMTKDLFLGSCQIRIGAYSGHRFTSTVLKLQSMCRCRKRALGSSNLL